MNEMQAHGLLIPVGSKPFEVWIDKNNSLAELQDLVNGNVEVLRVLGNGVDLWSMMKAYSTAANPIVPSMRRSIWRKSDISTS